MEPPAKKRTKSVSEAQKRYYEKTRDARLAQMRETARIRNIQEKRACEENPELLKVRRAKMLDKYYQHMMRDTEKRIKMWKEDKGICPTFKAFLTENVEPTKHLLPRKFFTHLSKCAIALKPVEEHSTITIVDGEEDTATHYANICGDKDW